MGVKIKFVSGFSLAFLFVKFAKKNCYKFVNFGKTQKLKKI